MFKYNNFYVSDWVQKIDIENYGHENQWTNLLLRCQTAILETIVDKNWHNVLLVASFEHNAAADRTLTPS